MQGTCLRTQSERTTLCILLLITRTGSSVSVQCMKSQSREYCSGSFSGKARSAAGNIDAFLHHPPLSSGVTLGNLMWMAVLSGLQATCSAPGDGRKFRPLANASNEYFTYNMSTTL